MSSVSRAAVRLLLSLVLSAWAGWARGQGAPPEQKPTIVSQACGATAREIKRLRVVRIVRGRERIVRGAELSFAGSAARLEAGDLTSTGLRTGVRGILSGRVQGWSTGGMLSDGTQFAESEFDNAIFVLRRHGCASEPFAMDWTAEEQVIEMCATTDGPNGLGTIQAAPRPTRHPSR